MIDQLFTVLERYAIFTEEQKTCIGNSLEQVYLKSGQNFIEADVITKKMGFILSGVLRFYYIDKSGNEITTNFLKKGDFVTVIRSFFNKEKAVGSIQAETNCQMLLIDRKNYEKLKKEIPEWHEGIVSFANEFLLENNIFQRGLINQDAKSSYKRLVTQFPEVTGKVPLGHIASYLGITQSTLSRIRKQISA